MSASVASSACSDLRDINDAKFANIMSFLEESSPPRAFGLGEAAHVPLTSAALASCASGPSAVPSAATRSVATNITNVSANHGQVYAGIRNKVEALRETSATLHTENQLLRQKLEQNKASEAQRVRKVQAMAQTEMEKLRSEYDGVNRRLSHALELRSREKEDLATALDSAKRELHVIQTSQDTTARTLQSQHDAAVLELKGKWGAQEKKLREQWAQKEEKRIKDATLRAMEPDIALLVNRHRADKARQHEEHLEAMQRKDEALAAKEAALTAIKATIMREAEELVVRERNTYRDRLKEETDRVTRQLDEDRRTAQQKRDALEAFFTGQKAAMQAEMRQLEVEVFGLRSQLAESSSKFHSTVTAEASKISEASSKTLNQLKQQLRGEHDAATARQAKDNLAYLAAREDELKRAAASERDLAISRVIQQLENEHIAALGQMKDTDRASREKYVKQDRELERLRVDLDLTLEQLRTAVAQAKAKDEELAKLAQLAAKRQTALDGLAEAKEREFDARLQRLDAEWHQKLRRFESMHVEEVEKALHDVTMARREAEREKERSDAELRAVQHRHSTELSSINDKVLVTVAKRDGTIRALQEQVAQLDAALRDRDQELQQTKQLFHA